jgi:hypothetical protein
MHKRSAQLRKRHGTSKQYLRGCFDWRPIDLLIDCGNSANGSGAGTRYNWVVLVRAREIEDNDNRSWPGSSTAERVPPGGATTGLHFDIDTPQQALKGPRYTELQSPVGSETGFMLKAPQSRVQRAPWLTTRCRLTRARRHLVAMGVAKCSRKTANFSFLSHKTRKWLRKLAQSQGTLRCVPPAPLSRLAPGYACCLLLWCVSGCAVIF